MLSRSTFFPIDLEMINVALGQRFQHRKLPKKFVAQLKGPVSDKYTMFTVGTLVLPYLRGGTISHVTNKALRNGNKMMLFHRCAHSRPTHRVMTAGDGGPSSQKRRM